MVGFIKIYARKILYLYLTIGCLKIYLFYEICCKRFEAKRILFEEV